MNKKVFYSFFVVLSFSIFLSPGYAKAEGETNWKHTPPFKGKPPADAIKKKCNYACATVMPKCKSSESAVNVGTSEDCCPQWQCRANLDDKVEPSPLDHMCPQAPAIMRVCKNNVEPTVSTVRDDKGCGIPKQICPEDSDSSPIATTEESKQKTKKKIKIPRGNGNVIQ